VAGDCCRDLFYACGPGLAAVDVEKFSRVVCGGERFGEWFKVQCSRFKVGRFKIQGSRFKIG